MSAPAVAWGLAGRLGGALVPPGPRVSRAEAAAVVADLRACAHAAGDLVAEASGLPGGDPGVVLVVDRPTWLEHNVRLAAGIVGAGTPTSWRRLAGAVSGAQVGAALALVAQRVLGQFDPFADRPTLLLVAPNAVAAATALDVDRHAFGMWVCLHEVAHRHQFAHAPWLRTHVLGLVRRIVADETWPLAGWRPGQPPPRTLPELVLGPDGRRALTEVTAVMTLLEGHADLTMDRTDAVAGVADLRRRFQGRRERGGLDAVLAAVTGLDAKHAQYRDGGAFCRRVVDVAGLATLTRAFASPDHLPTMAEIADPARWLARVG